MRHLAALAASVTLVAAPPSGLTRYTHWKTACWWPEPVSTVASCIWFRKERGANVGTRLWLRDRTTAGVGIYDSLPLPQERFH